MSWNESLSVNAASIDQGSSRQHAGDSRVHSPKSFFLPLHYEARYQYPLLVWLHSDGFNENQINQVIPHISLRNFLAVGVRGSRAMDAAGHRYEWSDSAAGIGTAHDAVIHAVDEAAERFSVHPERIVLAGYRSGGAMALRIALRQPRKFAGVISLGGWLPQRGPTLANLDELRKRRLPMLWQWATGGDHYRDENLKRDIRSAMMFGSCVDVRQYVDDDEMTNVCLADVNQWMMRRVVAGDTASEMSPWESTPTSFSSN